MGRKKVKIVKLIVALIVLFIVITIFFIISILYEVAALNPKRNITFSYDALESDENIIKPIEKVDFVTEENCPVQIVDNGSCDYFYQFQQTVFGTVKIIFKNLLKKDVYVTISIGEKAEGAHVWLGNDDKSADRGVVYFVDDIMIPKGSIEYMLELPQRPMPVEIEFPENIGGVFPFCCCEIESREALEIENVFQIGIISQIDSKLANFECDDNVVNEVYDFCKNTIKYTTYAGVYVDGVRELTPYEADSYINALGHFSICNDYKIAKNTLYYLVDHHTWPTEWIFQTIFLAREYYLYSGDSETIKDLYPKLQICLLEKLRNSDGLIDVAIQTDDFLSELGRELPLQDIVDYPENQRDNFATDCNIGFMGYIRLSLKGMFNQFKLFISEHVGNKYAASIYKEKARGAYVSRNKISTPNAVVNAFYYQALRDMAYLSEKIGKYEDSERYKSETESFRELYIANFFSETDGLVKDALRSNHTSVHANIFALDFGLVPDVYRENVCAYLIKRGMVCGVYASHFLLEGLCKNGHAAEVIDLVNSQERNSWYTMIHSTGSKLATEAWYEDIKPNQDWNHAWATAPANIMPRYVVGIRPISPGGNVLSFEPQMDSLSQVNCLIPIKYGVISVEYKKDKNYSIITVDIPEKVEVRYIIQKHTDIDKLLIDGNVPNVKLEDGNQFVLFKSGHHIIIMG